MTEQTELLRRFGLLTAEEVGAVVGVTTKTLAEWRTSGHGPDYVKLGQSIRYREEAVRRWIADNERPATRRVGGVQGQPA